MITLLSAVLHRGALSEADLYTQAVDLAQPESHAQ